MRTRLALVALLALLPLVAFAAGGREQVLRLYYSASLNGNLDGCACAEGPKAGLVKRSMFLRGRSTADSLLVDAGDILSAAPDPELSSLVLEVYEELEYDAIGVGDQELADGVSALKARASRYPLVSNNLTLLANGNEDPLTAAPLTIRKGRLIIRVISLLDPGVFALYPQELRSRIAVAAPEEALDRMIAVPLPPEDQNAPHLTVLIYHGPLEAAEALVTARSDVEVVIVGHEQRLVPPRQAGAAILVSPGEEGNRVGILELGYRDGRITRSSNEFRLFDPHGPDDPDVRRRITAYRDALRRRIRGG